MYVLFFSGYSIFVVFGSLPECEADALLTLVPAVQSVKPQPLAPTKGQNVSSMVSNHVTSSEEDLQRALKLSLDPQDSQEEVEPEQDASWQVAISLSMGNSGTTSDESKVNQDDLELQKALCLSLKGHEQVPSSSTSVTSNKNDEEIGLQKALRLNLQGASPATEQDDLDFEKALKMSLECKSHVSCYSEIYCEVSTCRAETRIK